MDASTRAMAQARGYSVHQGAPQDGELSGLWWWTLHRGRWLSTECSAGEFATEEEVWTDIQALMAREHQERQQALMAKLQAGTRADGKVLVHEYGRDCDGVQYSGTIHAIEPTVEAFDAMRDETARWADGPFTLEILSATDAIPEVESRDLTMEAFEDGRPHVLLPGGVHATAPSDPSDDELPYPGM